MKSRLVLVRAVYTADILSKTHYRFLIFFFIVSLVMLSPAVRLSTMLFIFGSIVYNLAKFTNAKIRLR